MGNCCLRTKKKSRKRAILTMRFIILLCNEHFLFCVRETLLLPLTTQFAVAKALVNFLYSKADLHIIQIACYEQ
jgi:hypothetical protein